MNYLDVYYRALREYRAQTGDNRECNAQRKAFAQSCAENDRIVTTRNICIVDEDWIEAIEEGLVHIEKAIKEERQFIYSNGEVVPIEKVKHVSKDSVQHLAKHSNLISKEQEGEDIIPDHLYSVERLNDYAVYENRFLYMLLCYLRDFITIRYDKILDLSNRYEGELSLNKEIALPKQRITYTVSLRDERKDDKYMRDHNPCKDVIDRIDLILKTVVAFLATPLMEIAGKAAKLKPPITKTNVLKMDNNFKGAVALYDYIIAYDKQGYSIESKTVELSPFSDEIADEIAEAGTLLSFLTYEYGLGLNAHLKNRYAAEEERRRAEKVRLSEEQLENVKRKLARMEQTPEEYILALEKHVKLIQSENRQLDPLRVKVAELKANEEALCAEIKALKEENAGLCDQITVMTDGHIREIAELRAECNEKIHENLVKHEQQMLELEAEFKGRIESLNKTMRETEALLNEAISAMREQLLANESEIGELRQRLAELHEDKLVCEARIKALMLNRGEAVGEELTDKESFDELERELETFVKFYEKRWGQVKKSIRKKLLNYQSLKEQNGQNKQP